MANPARVLHAVLASWKPDPRDFPGFAGTAGPSLWREVELAAHLLGRIDHLLTAMANDLVDVRRHQERWTGWWYAVISHAKPVMDLEPEYYITDETLAELEELADLFDGKLWQLDARAEQSLREALRTTRDALERDTELSGELRLFISRQLNEIEAALNDARLGAVYDFGTGISQLYVAVKAAEGENTRAQSAWRSIWTNTLGALAAIGIEKAVTYGAPIIFKAITG